jgi:hypothetical protein
MNIEEVRRIINEVEAQREDVEFFGPQSAEVIVSVEKALNVSFPEDYRVFLREFGGGGTYSDPISGIWPKNPFELGSGSVFGDTIRARADNALPHAYIVVRRYQDIYGLWVMNTTMTRSDGTSPVFSFPWNGVESECEEVANSFSLFVEQYLTEKLD